MSFYATIFIGILTILGAIGMKYLIPFINVKLDKEQFTTIIQWATIFVRSAEEIYKQIPKSGKEKHKQVREWLKETFEGLTDEEIDILIKAIVNKMNEGKDKILEG